MMLNETRVMPRQLSKNAEQGSETNLWYLDNGASNHMTGFKSKFVEIDEGIT